MGVYGIGVRTVIIGLSIVFASAFVWARGAYLPHDEAAIAEFRKAKEVYEQLEAMRSVTRSMGIRVNENARLGLPPEQRGKVWKMYAYAGSGLGLLLVVFGWVLMGARKSTEKPGSAKPGAE